MVRTALSRWRHCIVPSVNADHRRVELVAPRGEGEELVARLFHRRRLVPALALGLERLVGADDIGGAVGLADAQRLGLGKGQRDLARRLAGRGQRRLDQPLVDPRRQRLDRHAGVPEDADPRRAGRCEDDARHTRSDRGFRRARSSRSATIAAAVSSIERRVTSMIGQPWRAQSFRASAISAAMAALST